MVQAVHKILSALPITEDLGKPVAGVLPQPDLIPFQKFLDQAVESLNQVSGAEQAANDAVQKYTQGKISLEDAVFSMNEVTTTIQLANQVVTNAAAAFRELEQMQV